MKRLLPAGTEVEFDTDVEPLDRFGRNLVYLYKDASAKLQQQQRSTAREAKEVAAFETNPGDVKDCADFDSYDEAKAWFDRYYPAYGDVAKLDGDGDLKPCEALIKHS